MRVRLNLLLAVTTSMACAGGSEAADSLGGDAGSSTAETAASSGTTLPDIPTTGISGADDSEDSTTAGDTSTTGEDVTSGDGTSGDATTASDETSTGDGSTTGTDDTDTEDGTDGCDLITPDATCETAATLGSVSGDRGSEVDETGSGSTWRLVEVQETSGSIFEQDLSYTVALESPPGVDYDLFVYQGPQGGEPDCGATAIQGTANGTLETVSADWDDDQGIGGEDDGLWLAIEIVNVSGSDCAAQWTLTVTGGT